MSWENRSASDIRNIDTVFLVGQRETFIYGCKISLPCLIIYSLLNLLIIVAMKKNGMDFVSEEETESTAFQGAQQTDCCQIKDADKDRVDLGKQALLDEYASLRK
ncbi:hypothetical protein KSF_005740 [Reticulibacter mediterranei]|uniref:Uncharacterized protein n=1 Tax=Reticulibacter mediterranei TaxID=2778369 RepID=A0A8J3IHV1_9CHLR|nr:hypothetical protein [Reticulibacter mediterranei]GHO90526.1 hypothetical protein KSF_005740 [Reticulibacter mediterranei]